MKFPFLIVAGLLFFSCKKAATEAPQVCLNDCRQTEINNILSQPKAGAFYRIDGYMYNGAAVYLYYPGCCDGYNELKDANCNYLFSPSGGIAGGGDHTHPNFFKEAIFVMTVWVDPRP